jgi:hypothetical protein
MSLFVLCVGFEKDQEEYLRSNNLVRQLFLCCCIVLLRNGLACVLEDWVGGLRKSIVKEHCSDAELGVGHLVVAVWRVLDVQRALLVSHQDALFIAGNELC